MQQQTGALQVYTLLMMPSALLHSAVDTCCIGILVSTSYYMIASCRALAVHRGREHVRLSVSYVNEPQANVSPFSLTHNNNPTIYSSHCSSASHKDSSSSSRKKEDAILGGLMFSCGVLGCSPCLPNLEKLLLL